MHFISFIVALKHEYTVLQRVRIIYKHPKQLFHVFRAVEFKSTSHCPRISLIQHWHSTSNNNNDADFYGYESNIVHVNLLAGHTIAPKLQTHWDISGLFKLVRLYYSATFLFQYPSNNTAVLSTTNLGTIIFSHHLVALHLKSFFVTICKWLSQKQLLQPGVAYITTERGKLLIIHSISTSDLFKSCCPYCVDDGLQLLINKHKKIATITIRFSCHIYYPVFLMVVFKPKCFKFHTLNTALGRPINNQSISLDKYNIISGIHTSVPIQQLIT